MIPPWVIENLVISVLLLPIVWVVGFRMAETMHFRAWRKFFLSPAAVAVCDVDGCDHFPGVDLGGGVRVCSCHL